MEQPVNKVERQLPVRTHSVLGSLHNGMIDADKDLSVIKGNHIGRPGAIHKVQVDSGYLLIPDDRHLHDREIRENTTSTRRIRPSQDCLERILAESPEPFEIESPAVLPVE